MLKNKKRMIRKSSKLINVFVFLMIFATACGFGGKKTASVNETTPKPTEASTDANAQESESGGKDGGNPYNNDSETELYIVSVLVSADKYYYKNEPISLDEIADMLKAMQGDFIVEITDDNATHNAYKNLTDKLEELEVSFTEKE